MSVFVSQSDGQLDFQGCCKGVREKRRMFWHVGRPVCYTVQSVTKGVQILNVREIGWIFYHTIFSGGVGEVLKFNIFLVFYRILRVF